MTKKKPVLRYDVTSNQDRSSISIFVDAVLYREPRIEISEALVARQVFRQLVCRSFESLIDNPGRLPVLIVSYFPLFVQ